MSELTWREWVWRQIHLGVNRVARWWAGPPYRGFDRNGHWLWRLNDWVADRYIWSWRWRR